MIDWSKVVRYGICLFIAQVAIGFAEGFLFSGVGSSDKGAILQAFAISALVSFAVCTVVFAHLVASQADRPFLHACLALLCHGGLSLALALLLPAWLDDLPLPIIAMEWLTLVAALNVGVFVGTLINRRMRARACVESTDEIS